MGHLELFLKGLHHLNLNHDCAATATQSALSTWYKVVQGSSNLCTAIAVGSVSAPHSAYQVWTLLYIFCRRLYTILALPGSYR